LGDHSEARERTQRRFFDHIRPGLFVVLSTKYQVAFNPDRPGALGAIGIFNYGLRFVRAVRRCGIISASITIFRVHREAEQKVSNRAKIRGELRPNRSRA